jgi:hypothetical protein
MLLLALCPVVCLEGFAIRVLSTFIERAVMVFLNLLKAKWANPFFSPKVWHPLHIAECGVSLRLRLHEGRGAPDLLSASGGSRTLKNTTKVSYAHWTGRLFVY